MKRISHKQVIYKFKQGMEPVARAASGDTLIFETNDCWHQQVKSEDQQITEVDESIQNPATGPVYVEGAEPGDVLEVKIKKIDVQEQGSSVTIPGGGLLGDKVKKPIVRIIKVKDGEADYMGLKLPIRPMIGVIGVAPFKEDGEWPTATPWKHGGNMDTSDIAEGSTLYFPVAEEGALLAMGDCHAIMGDGELCFTGLEIPAEVTVELKVIKNKNLEWPVVETQDHIMVIASGETMEDASRAASIEAVKYLQKAHGMEWEEAYILASLAMDLKISQLVDPKLTIRAAIPKYLLSREDFLKVL